MTPWCTPTGAISAVRDYLSELTITRSFLAHEIAMQLGSRACPLTEELARGLCEGTEPAAGRWRAAGFFREPMPLPDDVSWRDRFLLPPGATRTPWRTGSELRHGSPCAMIAGSVPKRPDMAVPAPVRRS